MAGLVLPAAPGPSSSAAPGPGRPPGQRFRPRSFRSGLTRSDGAGTGSRARPESESDLPHDQDRIGAIPSAYIQKHAPRQALRDTAGSPAPPRPGRGGKDERPGEDPGPFG